MHLVGLTGLRNMAFFYIGLLPDQVTKNDFVFTHTIGKNISVKGLSHSGSLKYMAVISQLRGCIVKFK